MISILPFLAWIAILIFTATGVASLFYLMRKSRIQNPSALEIIITLLLLLSICFIWLPGYFLYDYYQPNRIFNRYFGFQPNDAVRNLQGFDLQGYDANLSFQTNEEQISLIISGGFRETAKENTVNVPSEVFELVQKPMCRIYKKELSSASYYLVYDQESGKAFFYLVSLD
jgi:hypothetical protein